MSGNHTYKIHLFKEKRAITCPAESTILEATLAANINHTHACGAKGKCSTCKVSIMEGIENCSPRNNREQKIATKLSFPSEIRLACQTKLTGNIAIRRMVSDQMDVDMVLEQISKTSDITLGSQQKLTVVFTDIENYTSLAERFPPYDTVYVLNRYYRIMNAIIEAHHGLISDVAGDGILAVFGFSKKCKNSVLDAVRSIKKMNERLVQFNAYLSENFNTTFGIRAGVHYGNVIAGPFDTGAMKKLAVIGDTVNYASRIESANKEFGTKLLLSEEAYQEIKSHYPNHKVYETTLKGKTGRYKLYSL
ncbi:MAG: adenylate/guanylate cyclase domain-containing protein [Flammeovirgaceae bacterium]